MTIQYTHKTREGRPARIVCTDRRRDELTVIALILGEDGEEYLYFLRPDLRQDKTDETPLLTDKSIWEDVAVDTPVWVLKTYRGPVPMHFHKYDGKYVWLFTGGFTSHTSLGTQDIRYLPDEVSLEKPSDA